jgi:hypothetical protein
MPNDFYPRTEGEKLTFLGNFMNGFSGEATALGFLPAELTALGAGVSAYQTAVGDKAGKRAAAQSASAVCAAREQAIEDALRATVRRIKAATGYTRAIGELLGIERGGISPVSATVERPDLQARSVLHGEVELGFIKYGYTGVEIEGKRAGEAEFTFLARDTETPYLDNRANLSAAPETRHYRARYLQKDTVTAEYSDVLVVTVPGAA